MNMTFKKSPCERILCSLEGPHSALQNNLKELCVLFWVVRCQCVVCSPYIRSCSNFCPWWRVIHVWQQVSLRKKLGYGPRWALALKLTTNHPVELESGIISPHERPQGPSLRLMFSLKFNMHIVRDMFVRLSVNCNAPLWFEKRRSVDSEIRSFGARCKRRGFSSGAAARHSHSARVQTDFFSRTLFFCFWDLRFSCPVSKQVVSGFKTKNLSPVF